jgi:xanthine/uracil permease
MLILATIQWLVFMVANIVTVPIVLGNAFEMSPHEIARFTNQTFFVCGIIGILQVGWGHRYPILEGPAGMWWGVVTVLIQMTKDRGGSLPELRQELETGLMIAGAIYMGLAGFGWLDRMRSWFTPAVTGTFLVLLSLQLSRSLVSGMLGIGYTGHSGIIPSIILLSLALVCLTIGLMTKGKGLIKSLAILISLLVGWILYALLGLIQVPFDPSLSVVMLPKWLPWGLPTFHMGVIITSVLTGLILLSNIIASIQAFGSVVHETIRIETFRRGTFVSGIGTVLSGLFGTVGCVPLTVAASFVSLTGIAARLPFLLASLAVSCLGCFPRFGQLVATLPAPVGYAVLFTVFGQLLGFGLLELKKLSFQQRDLFVISLPLMAGVGMYFVPGQVWMGMSPLVGYLFGNGLIVGVLLVLLLEHLVFRQTSCS